MLMVSANYFADRLDKLVGAVEDVQEARGYFWKYAGASLLYLGLISVIAFAGALIAAILSGIFFSAHQTAAGAVSLFLIAVPTLFGVVYFSIRWAIFGVACVLENLSPLAALSRSHALLKDRVNPIVGEILFFFCFTLLVFIPLVIFNGIAGHAPTANLVVSTVYQFITNLLLLPLWVCIMVTFYSRAKQSAQNL